MFEHRVEFKEDILRSLSYYDKKEKENELTDELKEERKTVERMLKDLEWYETEF